MDLGLYLQALNKRRYIRQDTLSVERKAAWFYLSLLLVLLVLAYL